MFVYVLISIIVTLVNPTLYLEKFLRLGFYAMSYFLYKKEYILKKIT